MLYKKNSIVNSIVNCGIEMALVPIQYAKVQINLETANSFVAIAIADGVRIWGIYPFCLVCRVWCLRKF